MQTSLQKALQKYKAGDYQGVVRDNGALAARNAIKEQNLLVVLAQSFLKLGNSREAANAFRMAGDAIGQNNVAYLLLAGSLCFRDSRIADAYAIACRLKTLAPQDPKAMALYYRTLGETCLFAEIDHEHAMLRARLEQNDAFARSAEDAFGNIAWCGDEEINAKILPNGIARPVTAAMQAERRARPHRWGDRLRIGYLTDDYHENHPMMRLFQGVMVSHDASRFDVAHFCFTPADKIAGDTMRQHYPNLVRIGHMSDAEAAQFIRSREIDILVDLKGHTNGCRPDLINLGLAPLQVAWHGFAGSATGIDCDYALTDRIVTPDSSIPHYHEKLCRLPESYQPNDNIFRPLPPAPSRASLGLPEDKVVLGFFNATRKMTPETYRVTMDILRRTDNTALWILFFNDFGRDNFLAAARRDGVDMERIILAPKARYADHIARMRATDLVLDAFPFNGHTTTSDALWAGVPALTYRGTHFASRVSESLLEALDMPDLVAADAEGYIELACALATDHARRQAIRDRIDANRHTTSLFDTKRFTRHLELAFEMIADRARRGLPPELIDVPALPRETRN